MLKGKTAIITGGVRGIGKAIAKEFGQNGANLVLCYKGNEAAAAETAGELLSLGIKAELLKGDVTQPDFAVEAVKKAKEVFGTVDILVNNAGITRDKLIMRMGPSDFTEVIDTNLNGSFYFLKAAAEVMIKQKSGRIINLSSVVGIKGNPGQINYCASKAGVIGMTLSAAKELGRRGITVNAIAPGFISTDMTHALTEEQKTRTIGAIAMGRAGAPGDIAKTALFLASEGAGYVTGQVISVDGGMSL